VLPLLTNKLITKQLHYNILKHGSRNTTTYIQTLAQRFKVCSITIYLYSLPVSVNLPQANRSAYFCSFDLNCVTIFTARMVRQETPSVDRQGRRARNKRLEDYAHNNLSENTVATMFHGSTFLERTTM
jgi:hypothetical protein